jgi:hypothetical protein
MKAVSIMKFPTPERALAIGAVAAACLLSHTAQAQAVDPVVLSFSTVGDSRQDPVKADVTSLPMSGQDYHWLQNSKAWSRIMREVTSKKSNLLFFNGDMIMGYGNASAPSSTDINTVLSSDLVKAYTQYAFWRGMVAPLIEAGTYVVPVPGNHETQCKAGTLTSPAGITASVTTSTVWANVSCKDMNGVSMAKGAMKVNEDAWRANMGDLIIDSTRLNAVLPGGLNVTHANTADNSAFDNLPTSQSQLSYSFDVGNSHFVVINTDPTGADGTPPTNWLASDLANAQSNGATHFFVFGHKPAFTYYYPGATAGGLDATAPISKRDAFWAVIEQYGATYFTGHEHIFNMRQPVKPDGSTSPSYQVLVGSGGSPFDYANTTLQAGQPASDRMYAYANVKVFQSGKVQIDAYGFNDAYGPTKLLQTAVLAH